MFLGIYLDIASPDSKNEVIKLLSQYGIKKVASSLYESFDFPLKHLGSFKKDLTSCIDMDDKVRLYQYPLEESFKISIIEERKWKRLSIK